MINDNIFNICHTRPATLTFIRFALVVNFQGITLILLYERLNVSNFGQCKMVSKE